MTKDTQMLAETVKPGKDLTRLIPPKLLALFTTREKANPSPIHPDIEAGVQYVLKKI